MGERISIYLQDDEVDALAKLKLEYDKKTSRTIGKVILEHEAILESSNDLLAQKLITSLSNIIDIKNDETLSNLKKPINELAVQVAINNNLLLGMIDIDEDDLKEVRLKAIDEVYGTDYYSKSKKY